MFSWTCNGDGTAPTLCKNAKGETVGSVKKDDQGHAIVYDKKGVVVGRSSVSKGSGAKTYIVDIGQTAGKSSAKQPGASANPNDGLYLASVKDWTHADCYQGTNVSVIHEMFHV
jgi:hypothetical protein